MSASSMPPTDEALKAVEKKADDENTQIANDLRHFSPADRLEILSNPASPMVWAYAFVYDHMLACIMSPQANDHLDLWKAAHHGFNILLLQDKPELNLRTNEHGVEILNLKSTRVAQAQRLLFYYQETTPVWNIAKALSNLIVDGGLDDCSICHENLSTNTSDTQWHEANPEKPFQMELLAMNPDFAMSIFFGDWDDNASRRRTPWTCMHAASISQRLDHKEDRHQVSDANSPLVSRYMWLLENFREAFLGQLKAKQAKIDADKVPEHKFVVKLECKHRFHRICLRRWLTTQGTCPNCRLDIAQVPKPESPLPEDLANAQRGGDFVFFGRGNPRYDAAVMTKVNDIVERARAADDHMVILNWLESLAIQETQGTLTVEGEELAILTDASTFIRVRVQTLGCWDGLLRQR